MSGARFDALEYIETNPNAYASQLLVALLGESDDEIRRLRDALERVYQTGRGPHVEIAREALNA